MRVQDALTRRGLRLEYATLGWNVIGVPILVIAAVRSGSAAAAGFAFDSAIEIGASLVVVWELTGTHEDRERIGLRLIGCAFLALAVYVTAQAAYSLIGGHHPGHSTLGIVWTAATCIVMLALARGKAITGSALGNPVLQAEGRVTLVDACLAAAVLVGLTLNAVARVVVGRPSRRTDHRRVCAPGSTQRPSARSKTHPQVESSRSIARSAVSPSGVPGHCSETFV